MAQIKVDSEEFPNIVICYLLESIQSMDEMPFTNELYIEVLVKMKNAGIRSNLLWAYMNTSTNLRVRYKMIRKALFNEGRDSSTIKVIPSGESPIQPEDKPVSKLMRLKRAIFGE